jgi:hypothetical protein
MNSRRKDARVTMHREQWGLSRYCCCGHRATRRGNHPIVKSFIREANVGDNRTRAPLITIIMDFHPWAFNIKPVLSKGVKYNE